MKAVKKFSTFKEMKSFSFDSDKETTSVKKHEAFEKSMKELQIRNTNRKKPDQVLETDGNQP